jgi:hypothetical protein
VLEPLIQPIVNSAKSESMSPYLAMGAGTLRCGKTHEGLGTGEVFVELLGLTLEEHVLLRIED